MVINIKRRTVHALPMAKKDNSRVKGENQLNSVIFIAENDAEGYLQK